MRELRDRLGDIDLAVRIGVNTGEVVAGDASSRETFVTGDPVATAKSLRDFAKANPALVVKGGVLDGRALTAADVTKLADVESREVLLAKAAGAFKAKLYQAAYLFTAPASKAVRTVEALRAKQEESAA